MTESEQNNNRTYQPVETHWFWLSPDQCWKPFSRIDSTALENAYQESIELTSLISFNSDLNIQLLAYSILSKDEMLKVKLIVSGSYAMLNIVYESLDKIK